MCCAVDLLSCSVFFALICFGGGAVMYKVADKNKIIKTPASCLFMVTRNFLLFEYCTCGLQQ